MLAMTLLRMRCGANGLPRNLKKKENQKVVNCCETSMLLVQECVTMISTHSKCCILSLGQLFEAIWPATFSSVDNVNFSGCCASPCQCADKKHCLWIQTYLGSKQQLLQKFWNNLYVSLQYMFRSGTTFNFPCTVLTIYHQISWFLWRRCQIHLAWPVPATSSRIQNTWRSTERTVSAASIYALWIKSHLMDNKGRKGHFYKKDVNN